MKPNDLGEERLGHGLHGVGVRQRNEVGVLAETVHHREDDRLALHLGESFYEVEANVTPHHRGHRKRKQQPGRMEVLRLVALACGARADEILDDGPHAGEVKIPTQPM
jgi:hypothetical protein